MAKQIKLTPRCLCDSAGAGERCTFCDLRCELYMKMLTVLSGVADRIHDGSFDMEVVRDLVAQARLLATEEEVEQWWW